MQIPLYFAAQHVGGEKVNGMGRVFGVEEGGKNLPTAHLVRKHFAQEMVGVAAVLWRRLLVIQFQQRVPRLLRQRIHVWLRRVGVGSGLGLGLGCGCGLGVAIGRGGGEGVCGVVGGGGRSVLHLGLVSAVAIGHRMSVVMTAVIHRRCGGEISVDCDVRLVGRW